MFNFLYSAYSSLEFFKHKENKKQSGSDADVNLVLFKIFRNILNVF